MRDLRDFLGAILAFVVAAVACLFVIFIPVIYWLSIIGGSLLLLRWFGVI